VSEQQAAVSSVAATRMGTTRHSEAVKPELENPSQAGPASSQDVVKDSNSAGIPCLLGYS
jgi:hypothetical protein